MKQNVVTQNFIIEPTGDKYFSTSSIEGRQENKQASESTILWKISFMKSINVTHYAISWHISLPCPNQTEGPFEGTAEDKTEQIGWILW